MADILQLRRGSTSQNEVFTGSLAEVVVDSDTEELVLHDGVKQGGYRQFNRDAIVPTLEDAKTLDVSVGFIIETQGYNSSGDGGSTLYEVVPAGTGTDDDGSFIDMSNGNQLKALFGRTISVKQFGAIGDSITDDSVPLSNAVSVAFSNKLTLNWPSSNYKASLNIDNFHDVSHIGYGIINNSDGLWYINPVGTEENVIYVSPSGTSQNDGLSEANPKDIKSAIDVLKKKDSGLLSGIWRVQLLQGTYTDTGVLLEGVPPSTNRIRIWGCDANGDTGDSSDLTTVPSVVWDGSTSPAGYAFRAENLYPSGTKLYHFKNIKFSNWSGGAIVMQTNADILSENLHASDCFRGFWYQGGRFRHIYGTVDGAQGFGLSGSYQVGGVLGGSNAGVVFKNCRVGARAGRNSTVSIRDCSFENIEDNCIEGQYLARVKTDNNDFSLSPNAVPVRLFGNSFWSGGTLSPNTYPNFTTFSEGPLVTGGGSTSTNIDTVGTKFLHNKSTGAPLVINDTQKNLLQTFSGNSTWAPYRLPGFFLHKNNIELELRVLLALDNGAGGSFFLNGEGTDTFVEVTIPDVTSFTNGYLTIKMSPRPESDFVRAEISYPPTGQYEIKTVVSNLPSVKTNLEDDLIWRVYWQSNNTTNVSLSDLSTWVTY